MKKIVVYLILISLYLGADELSFIGLDGGEWKIVVCKDKSCHTLKTEQEPRTYDYDFVNNKVVYVASDKSVRLVQNREEKILLKSQKDAYTEPIFIENGNKILIVKLVNGNSKKTQIISMDLNGKNHQLLVSQHSTALEAYSKNDKVIYYANVSCVEGCGHIIQEIWQKDTASHQAKQLTLLNALSHQPNLDSKEELVYFSSNKGGDYHIFSVSLKDGKVKQLTTGDFTDSFPISSNRGVYFIRREGNRVWLMLLEKGSNLQKVDLNQKYIKIRNLKVKQ